MPSPIELNDACHGHVDRRHGTPCEYQGMIDALRETLNRSLCGKSDVIEYVLACLLARGHLLIEDLPGLGKTTLAKALAHAVGGELRGCDPRPICCRTTSRVLTSSTNKHGNSSSSRGRSSPMYCWPTKSIVPRRGRRVRCSRRWRSDKSPWIIIAASCPTPSLSLPPRIPSRVTAPTRSRRRNWTALHQVEHRLSESCERAGDVAGPSWIVVGRTGLRRSRWCGWRNCRDFRSTWRTSRSLRPSTNTLWTLRRRRGTTRK